MVRSQHPASGALIASPGSGARQAGLLIHCGLARHRDCLPGATGGISNRPVNRHFREASLPHGFVRARADRSRLELVPRSRCSAVVAR